MGSLSFFYDSPICRVVLFYFFDKFDSKCYRSRQYLSRLSQRFLFRFPGLPKYEVPQLILWYSIIINLTLMTISIVNELDKKYIDFDQKIAIFSNFVNSDNPSDTMYRIPEEAGIITKFIKIMRQFVETHQYKIENVRFERCTRKIHKDAAMSTHTAIFVEKLQKMSDEDIQQLLKTASFLQVESLQRVIYGHLATKYGASHIDKEKDEQMQKYQVKKYDIEALKMEYIELFKEIGESLYENQPQ